MISVIICTHNPRADYLGRTLASLRAQSLPQAEWELLVIDNASAPALAGSLDLSWHTAARVIRENEVGLTAARLRAISESRHDLLVWVDDDNVMASDYLERAARLAREWPMLGVWGCGAYTPEWEETPAPELKPLLSYLAINTVDADRWSNRPYDYSSMPAGAGLCSRRVVAERYAENIRTDPKRKMLGRIGTQLSGCEDFDFALTSTDLGLGTGVFRELALTHLMPRSRVQREYLIRLVEGHAYSTVLLMAVRQPSFRPQAQTWLSRLRGWRRRRSLGPAELAIDDAKLRGEAKALTALSAQPSVAN